MKKQNFSILTEIRNHHLSEGVITDIIFPEERDYTFGDGIHLRTYLEKCLAKNPAYDSFMIQIIIKAFIGYLEAPLIFDSCINHTERRAWEEKIEKEKPEYREIIENNRLGRSMVLNVLSIFDVILDASDREYILTSETSKVSLDQIKHQLKVQVKSNDTVPNDHRINLTKNVVLFVRNIIVQMMERYEVIPQKVSV